MRLLFGNGEGSYLHNVQHQLSGILKIFDLDLLRGGVFQFHAASQNGGLDTVGVEIISVSAAAGKGSPGPDTRPPGP